MPLLLFLEIDPKGKKCCELIICAERACILFCNQKKMDYLKVDALPIFLSFKTCKEKNPFLASITRPFLFGSNKGINYSTKLGI